MNLSEKSKRIHEASKAYNLKKEEILLDRKLRKEEQEKILDNFLSYLCSTLELKKKGMQEILIPKH